MVDTTADPYLVLGIPKDASLAQLRDAYRLRIRQTHPDLGGDPEEAAQVNQAWSLIGDPADRARYDRDRRSRQQESRASHVPEDASADADRPGRPKERARSAESPQTADTPPPVPVRDGIHAVWQDPIAWVPGGVWLAVTIAYVLLGGAESTPVWISAAAFAAATWLPVLRRGRKLPAIALIVAVAVDIAYIEPITPFVVVIGSMVAVWVGAWWARRRQREAIYQSLREQYTNAVHQPGVTGWIVRTVEPGAASTRCLLEQVTTGRLVTWQLWGDLRAGDMVALRNGDTSDLPVALLPVEAQRESRRRTR